MSLVPILLSPEIYSYYAVANVQRQIVSTGPPNTRVLLSYHETRAPSKPLILLIPIFKYNT